MRPICEKGEEMGEGQANTAAAKGARNDAPVLEVYLMGTSIRPWVTAALAGSSYTARKDFSRHSTVSTMEA